MASTVSFKNILLTRCIQIQLESETAICLFYWFCRFNKNIYIFVISKKKKMQSATILVNQSGKGKQTCEASQQKHCFLFHKI